MVAVARKQLILVCLVAFTRTVFAADAELVKVNFYGKLQHALYRQQCSPSQDSCAFELSFLSVVLRKRSQDTHTCPSSHRGGSVPVLCQILGRYSVANFQQWCHEPDRIQIYPVGKCALHFGKL